MGLVDQWGKPFNEDETAQTEQAFAAADLYAQRRGSAWRRPGTWLCAFAWLNLFALIWCVLLGVIAPDLRVGLAGLWFVGVAVAAGQAT